MTRKELLHLAEASRLPSGKWKLPQYKRSYTEKEVLEKIAKNYGAKSYKDLQNAQRLKGYKRYAERANKAGISKDKQFFKDFFELKKVNFKGKKAKKIFSKIIVKLAEQQRQAYRIGYDYK